MIQNQQVDHKRKYFNDKNTNFDPSRNKGLRSVLIVIVRTHRNRKTKWNQSKL